MTCVYTCGRARMCVMDALHGVHARAYARCMIVRVQCAQCMFACMHGRKFMHGCVHVCMYAWRVWNAWFLACMHVCLHARVRAMRYICVRDVRHACVQRMCACACTYMFVICVCLVIACVHAGMYVCQFASHPCSFACAYSCMCVYVCVCVRVCLSVSCNLYMNVRMHSHLTSAFCSICCPGLFCRWVAFMFGGCLRQRAQNWNGGNDRPLRM